MVKYGSWDGWGLGTGIVPLPATLPYHHPGYTPPLPRAEHAVCTPPHRATGGVQEAVGLKSVAQLSLRPVFSGLWTITEVYNLLVAGIPDDHYCIPGNK